MIRMIESVLDAQSIMCEREQTKACTEDVFVGVCVLQYSEDVLSEICADERTACTDDVLM